MPPPSAITTGHGPSPHWDIYPTVRGQDDFLSRAYGPVLGVIILLMTDSAGLILIVAGLSPGCSVRAGALPFLRCDQRMQRHENAATSISSRVLFRVRRAGGSTHRRTAPTLHLNQDIAR